MAKTLFIVSESPYGSERSDSALRLVASVSKRDGEHVKVFLSCASVAFMAMGFL